MTSRQETNDQIQSWGGQFAAAEMLDESGNHWRVRSSDGTRNYSVQFAGRGESDGVSLWTCDCPAGQHGKTCKHINLVGDICGRLD